MMRLQLPRAGRSGYGAPAVGAGLALLVLLPLFGASRYWLVLGMQVWVLAAYAYSYQLLFGRAGMLSFGHAVYFGLGAFAAAHALNSRALAAMGLPVEMIPLIGMLAGLGAAVVFGFPSTRRAGTPFAMVTLGIGELVAACFLMFPGFFGGEAGISTNRAALGGWVAANYGAADRAYVLIALWALALGAMALWIARTPLGLLARATRDNAARLAFCGIEPSAVRFRLMLVAGALAGAAGALSTLLNEIVSVESVSLAMSANVLLMTVVGGPAHAFGPLLGALTLTLMQSVLSRFTHAWVFYYGLMFILTVLFAPNGLTGIVSDVLRNARQLGAGGMARRYGAPVAAALLAGLLAIGTIEIAFFRDEGIGAARVFPAWGAAGLSLGCLAALLWLRRSLRGLA
ncbi:MAG: branched-chain amino acid transport system permease [Beijerinckiaceae bacterium]|nr:MAG: branched-chain amino acid transport system permease [Beijerinckiaceae bacterium]